MIKRERLIQVTACLAMCVMMPAGVTCYAASIPCEVSRDHRVFETVGEKIVEGTSEIQKNIQKELIRLEIERQEQERLEKERLERERQEQEAKEKAAQEARLAEEERQRQAASQQETEVQETGEVQTAYETQNVTAVGTDVQELLAAIIFCEAGNQPYEGQVAVGAVVLNRVASGLFPNSVEEVIYQSGQFGPAVTGWLDQVRSSAGYTPEAFQAAADALNGADPVEGCLYFDQGGYGFQIGAHYFH